MACPRCKLNTETMAHIFQCLEPTAQVGDQNIQELQTLLKDQDTDPNVI